MNLQAPKEKAKKPIFMRSLFRPRTLINVATEPTVFLAAGTAVLTSSFGLSMYLINGAMLALALTTRTMTELIDQGLGERLPKPVKNFIRNKGAAMQMRGLTLFTGAIINALTNNMGDLAMRSKTIILGLFSSGLFARGRALKEDISPLQKKFSDAAGMSLISGGTVFLAGSSIPIIIPATMITAGVISITQAFNKRTNSALGKYQIPDILMSGALLGTAALSVNIDVAITNTFYSAAYISLIANRSFGGVAQAGQHIIRSLIHREKDFSPK